MPSSGCPPVVSLPVYLLATVTGPAGPLYCTVSFFKFSLSEIPALPKTHTPPATENRERACLHCTVIRVSEGGGKAEAISSTSPHLSRTDLSQSHRPVRAAQVVFASSRTTRRLLQGLSIFQYSTPGRGASDPPLRPSLPVQGVLLVKVALQSVKSPEANKCLEGPPAANCPSRTQLCHLLLLLKVHEPQCPQAGTAIAHASSVLQLLAVGYLKGWAR